MLELIGMGLMYGPIKPDTKAIGNKRGNHGKGSQNGGATDFIDRHAE
jgi:hypothetical protein